jgi:hypothetical protein
MTSKEALHALIDQLPDDVLPAVERYLRSVQPSGTDHPLPAIPEDDPLWLAFQNAPDDDEPLTPEDIAAIEEAEAELARGEGIPWEVVRERLMRND